MSDPKKVRRSDYKHAHHFLLKYPLLCAVLAGVFAFIGTAFYLDWFGHSAVNQYWELKNQIGACIGWAAAAIMAGYAFVGRKKAQR